MECAAGIWIERRIGAGGGGGEYHIGGARDIIRIMRMVYLAFLVMSFVDGIGVAMSRMDGSTMLPAWAKIILPSLLFVWFFVLSVPAAGWSRKYGRKEMSVLALALTGVALVLPVFGVWCPVGAYFLSFGLLGAANVILQVSLPAVAVSAVSEKRPAGVLMSCVTWKTAMSAVLPLFFTVAAAICDWRIVFPIGAICAFGVAYGMGRVSLVKSEISDVDVGMFGALGLLRDAIVFCIVLGFAIAVCLDVMLNLAIPQVLKAAYGWSESAAGIGCSVYFCAKIPAMQLGAVILSRTSPFRLLLPSIGLVALGLCLFWCSLPVGVFLVAILLLSVGSANLYGIVFGLMVERHPNQAAESSALLVMTISSGAFASLLLEVFFPG